MLYICHCFSGGFFKREGRLKDHEVLSMSFKYRKCLIKWIAEAVVFDYHLFNLRF